MPALVTAWRLQLAHAASGDGSIVGRISAAGTSASSSGAESRSQPGDRFQAHRQGRRRRHLPLPVPAGRHVHGRGSEGRQADWLARRGDRQSRRRDDREPGPAAASRSTSINVVGTRVVNAVDVTSTESRDQHHRAKNSSACRSSATCFRRAARAGRRARATTSAAVRLSFGGSSVAENTVYINGLNVTDFYNRIGFSSVPFAFYEEFQVKTGGYSVEFGRTTGGVINAVTRSGTNEFEFGSEVMWEPDFLQSLRPATQPGILGRSTTSTTAPTSRLRVRTHHQGQAVLLRAVRGARLQPGQHRQRRHPLRRRERDDDFWGAKIDWHINDRNLLELLAFSDEQPERSRQLRLRCRAPAERGDIREHALRDLGGDNWALTYTGYLTDNLSAKALYGENERNSPDSARTTSTATASATCARSSAVDVGCTNPAQYRHAHRHARGGACRLRVGPGRAPAALRLRPRDRTSRTRAVLSRARTRLLYEVRRVDERRRWRTARPVPAGVTEFVRTRQNEVAGSFETHEHRLLPRRQLAGHRHPDPQCRPARREPSTTRTREGDSYIKIDNMIAPRLGFSWDVKGDGRTKLFGNAGRYFLPVANVINIKQAGGFLDERTFYVFNGFEDVRVQRHHAPAPDPRARRSAGSTTRRATAPSATCAAKSTPTWIRSTRTSSSSASSP